MKKIKIIMLIMVLVGLPGCYRLLGLNYYEGDRYFAGSLASYRSASNNDSTGFDYRKTAGHTLIAALIGGIYSPTDLAVDISFLPFSALYYNFLWGKPAPFPHDQF